ncbi:AglZ/HisF2 family acetamidino modification protein [Laribacter hongkongensis]|uniref:imidazole glycerol-phosphate synthase n=1 Tax=Laribacter hongkongensis TaxID=168471 RepID=A0ABD4STU1_9NEIS|nr:AglZ/HisF2 family acetamidino modification protein [Laribacter hongkongensis]MCG9026054.1 AglZ/HisF2 family acetamidino modification protein [Laribacter hongkongensis]MCG9116312.1 AglZ/HisF2 family acetamidino modification protein [Laribacter hongkongensis]MCG9124931.1 AglZ/HisF2 family acetamidino modification protein [Laribacter hongkongensis]
MWLPRIIPCLLLDGNGLVKTRKFKNPTYVGDPINAIKIFNDKRVDELIFLDIAASREGKEPNYALLEKLASECFMPLCYGGGVVDAAQARRIISLGIEKVSVNAAAIESSALIGAIAAELGASSTVAAVDVRRNWLGRYRVYNAVRRKLTDLDPVAHVAALVKAGAGEVLINDTDTDGEQKGYDLGLVRAICGTVDVPVIACGGAGSLADMRAAIYDGGASAAAAGSLFVFKGPHRAVLINYPSQEQISELLGQPV